MFEYLDKIKNDRGDTAVIEEGLNDSEISAINKTRGNIQSITGAPIINKFKVQSFLRNLIAFQSSDFESLLLTKFGLSNQSQLKNYIIPIGTDTSERVDDELIYSTTNEAYIRWDALAALINDYLIPKSSKGLPPLKVVTDRVYNINKNTSKLDPLLFCPIVSYQSSTEDNMLLDFSCDANVCILPIQFDQNLAVEASPDADPLHISKILGYIPKTTQWPVDNITSAYGYGESNKSQKLNIIIRNILMKIMKA